jgi:hypothetical protein
MGYGLPDERKILTGNQGGAPKLPLWHPTRNLGIGSAKVKLAKVKLAGE